MVHITGGGFKKNIVRILPDDVNAEVNLGSWKQPKFLTGLRKKATLIKRDVKNIQLWKFGIS
ncbi:MAG: hypothetical protein Ct9H300mP6_09870 [Gammaproteobacteria bacterium]|nr:MAG: hypothetical protein Ct9H300mP6_09870 [Gammaproteobacteria bacterium]